MKSILNVQEYSDTYDLTILETVKLELGITDTNSDEVLAGWIHQASDQLASACGRVFAEETVQEVFRLGGSFRFSGEGHYYATNSLGVNVLSLTRRPVSSIISVIEDTVTLDSSEYECDFGAGILRKLWADNDILRSWSGNKITVNYIAGFRLLEDLPYDVERACIMLVKSYKSISDRRDLNLKSLEIPGVIVRSWETRGNQAYDSLPPEVQVLISPYVETIIR